MLKWLSPLFSSDDDRKYKRKIKSLVNELDKWKVEHATLKREHETFKAKAAEIIARAEPIFKQITKLNAGLETQKRIIAGLQSKLKAVEEELARANADKEELSSLLERERMERGKFERELAIVEAQRDGLLKEKEAEETPQYRRG